MPARGTLAGMSTHPFDQALTLSPLGLGRYAGHTAPAYWNMIGPYGGITAALVLQAVMQHPDRLGEPITLTVNFAGAVPAGPFEAHAVALRTNHHAPDRLFQGLTGGPSFCRCRRLGGVPRHA